MEKYLRANRVAKKEIAARNKHKYGRYRVPYESYMNKRSSNAANYTKNVSRTKNLLRVAGLGAASYGMLRAGILASDLNEGKTVKIGKRMITRVSTTPAAAKALSRTSAVLTGAAFASSLLGGEMLVMEAERNLQKKEREENNKNSLNYKFNQAKKDNPNLTYADIYKEQKADMSQEDNDYYKDVEAAWYKKHGY